ncbi:MAG: hypothetical protein II444_05550 [Firmicutes bacterium]|nr:hypothetical protein [Bacillota bacterium]MBQ5769284.1 hypothetical protein [Clostridiales bacterium]
MTLEEAKDYIREWCPYDKQEEIIKALEQESCDDEYIKVPKKALKYRTAGMVAYNAEWLKNHFDIERAVICGAQEPCEDAISRQAVEKITWEEPSYTDALNVLTEVREKIRQLPSVKSNVNVDALINKIETEFSWSMYDDWGNSTDLHDGLVDIIREWAESEDKE